MENQEFAALKGDIEKSLKTIENEGTGVKSAVKKLEDQFAAMNKAMDHQRLALKSHPLFGDFGQAENYINVLRAACEKSNIGSKIKTEECPLFVNKANLNTYGSGTGSELVPTATADVISLLLSQGGIARREGTVYSGIQGKLALSKRNGTSTAAFTNGSGVIKDDVSVTGVSPGTSLITLSPSQVVALSLVSEKLLYQSAINIAEFTAIDMIEQAGVLEDNTVIKGDGSSITYNAVDGINHNSGVVESTVAFGSFDLSNVIKLPGTVAEAAQMSPNAKFYMSGAVLSILRAQKSSGSGQFYMDPTTGTMKLSGYDVVVWHRVDNTVATGKYPVYFGDLKKALVIGTGRDMAITVDHSFAFGSVQAAFRLAYDFDAGLIQPTALARLKCLVS